MTTTESAPVISPDLASHLRITLDGRWRAVKDRCREQLSGEAFRPSYTPNTVIARARAMEQMKIVAVDLYITRLRLPNPIWKKRDEHGVSELLRFLVDMELAGIGIYVVASCA